MQDVIIEDKENSGWYRRIFETEDGKVKIETCGNSYYVKKDWALGHYDLYVGKDRLDGTLNEKKPTTDKEIKKTAKLIIETELQDEEREMEKLNKRAEFLLKEIKTELGKEERKIAKLRRMLKKV